MDHYHFDLAHPADDPAIRNLLRQNPVPGQMALTYEREPDYFLGAPVMGPVSQTLVARQLETQEVVGLATRSVRPLFVNGQVEEVGYIGQLRVAAAHRGRWILPQGFRLFHDLHQAGLASAHPATGYITTIIEGNDQAQGLLVEKARRHYPAYHRLDRLFTLALILGRRRRIPSGNWELRPADTVDLADLLACLHREGRRRHFFPALSPADLLGERTRGLNLADCVAACRGGRVVGFLALWDQSAYKQTVVRSYRADQRRLRPLYNLAARLLGAAPLTPIDQAIHFAYAAFPAVQDDDPTLLRALLAWVANRAVDRGFAFLMLGLTERDPLLTPVRRQLHIPYTSVLYTVCWPGDEAWRERLDGRPGYAEIATL